MIDHDADDADDTKDDDLTIQGERSILRGASPAFPSDGSCTPKQEWYLPQALPPRKWDTQEKLLKWAKDQHQTRKKTFNARILVLASSFFSQRASSS